jgi:hypothetical protein
MWAFFKNLSLFNKLLFGLVGLATLICTIVGLYIGLTRHYNRVFQRTKQGQDVYWESNRIPVGIIYHWKLNDISIALVRNHVKEANKEIGCSLFDLGTRAASETYWTVLKKGMESKKAKHRTLLFEVDWTEGIDGRTHLLWDERTGGILAGLITMGAHALDNGKAVKHELGHALGLLHDDKSDSIMHEGTLNRKQSFTPKDTERLREKYCAK